MEVARVPTARHPSPILSAGRPFTPTVYVVGWRDAEIVKVGWTGGRDRWRGFLARGAEVVSLTFYAPTDMGLDAECAIEAHLARRFERAFSGKLQAEPFLGAGGGGWTECFKVPVAAWPEIPTGADF